MNGAFGPLIARRSLLAAAGAAGAGLALGGCSTQSADPESFVNPLPIPPELSPAVDGDTLVFSLTAQAGTAEILPGKPADTWGYNEAYLGPTLRARRGDRVRVEFTNDLAETTTLHWHGMLLPAEFDGGPHQTVEPGGAWRPEWTIEQPAATLWYHPHVMGGTAEQVYRGLSGLFYIDDPAIGEAGVPSTYGVDDIPVIIQDRNLTRDGGLDLAGLNATYGILGDTMVVNGRALAALDVTTEAVRLRIVNACNARILHLEFDDQREFQVIATDVGALERPATATCVTLSNGERIEIVARLAPGEQVMLRSATGTNDVLDNEQLNVLRLRAGERLDASAALADELPGPAAPVLPSPPTARDFQFGNDMSINGAQMQMSRIDEVMPAGAVEQWRITNTVMPHNFHAHGCSFRVLDVNGEEPPAWQQGSKDTVLVAQGTNVRLAVQLADHADAVHPYMYHCHMLRHEDEGMMGQFVLVEPGTEASVDRTPPQLAEAG